MNPYELLQTLTETPGPSGFESDIAAVVAELWRPHVDDIEIDRLGTLTALKKGHGERRGENEKRPTVLLAAHIDEIGLMVSHLIEHQGYGFLRVVALGGVDIRHLYGQRVVIHGQQNLKGILGAAPNRVLPDHKSGKPYDFEVLVVDPGMRFDELRERVSIGDAITFDQPLRKLGRDRVTGKALDNRCSVAAVTLCLEYLAQRTHTWDVVAVGTSQEETRLLGAATAGYRLNPDMAIVIDVTFGNGPGASDHRSFKLGGGPVIGFAPDTHPAVTQRMVDAAKSIEMETQSEYVAYPGGTDAYALQIARMGIPTGIVGIALRYMHTMVETIDSQDVVRVARLLTETIVSLDEKTTDQFESAFWSDGGQSAQASGEK